MQNLLSSFVTKCILVHSLLFLPTLLLRLTELWPSMYTSNYALLVFFTESMGYLISGFTQCRTSIFVSVFSRGHISSPLSLNSSVIWRRCSSPVRAKRALGSQVRFDELPPINFSATWVSHGIAGPRSATTHHGEHECAFNHRRTPKEDMPASSSPSPAMRAPTCRSCNFHNSDSSPRQSLPPMMYYENLSRGAFTCDLPSL